MSLDDDLRNSLRRAATAVEPVSDLPDITSRSHRAGVHRRRVLAGATAIALAAPVGGFLALRAVDGESTPQREVAVNLSPVAARSPFGALVAIPRRLHLNSSRFLANASADPAAPELFHRTSDGIAIRAFKTLAATDPAPDDCRPDAGVIAELSRDGAVWQPDAAIFDEPTKPIIATAGGAGAGFDGPAEWAIVQVDDTVQRVRVRFADGGTDEMTPVDGLAVLAHAGLPSTSSTVFGTVETLDRDGRVIDRLELSGAVGGTITEKDLAELLNRTGYKDSFLGNGPKTTFFATNVDKCDAPAVAPPLPEPNGPPPADAGAAKAAVTDAFNAVYQATTPAAQRDALIDDPRGVDAAVDAGHKNFAKLFDALKVEIDEIVFVNDHEAALRYKLNLGPELGTWFGDETGHAVLEGGKWKVTHATLCDDLAKAGEHC